MDSLSKLIDHMIWANGAWRRFVEQAAPNDAFLAKIVSHLYLAEQVWLQRIAGEPVDAEVFRTRGADELDRMMSAHPVRFHELIASDISRVVAYQRFNGDAYEATVEEILLHLITHASHHRGQMAPYAVKLGLQALNTDYINYSLRGRA
ncbi:MAG TPA: DinB family protein [Candidatus Hydrogenedentes bacterium]|nr:DinB family protein [Candidatus Hydrogenedentota bacterium]